MVGCVDCVHIPIARPSGDQKKHFNKSYHSKKVQIVSIDLNLKKMNRSIEFSSPQTKTELFDVSVSPKQMNCFYLVSCFI